MIIQQFGRLINIIVLSAYLQAYVLISVTVLIILNIGVAVKIMKLKMTEAWLSAMLSVVQSSASSRHASYLPPVQVKPKIMKGLSLLHKKKITFSKSLKFVTSIQIQMSQNM